MGLELEHRVWKAKYDAARQQFTDGLITSKTFAAKLIELGFNEHAVRAEVTLHHPPSPGRPA